MRKKRIKPRCQLEAERTPSNMVANEWNTLAGFPVEVYIHNSCKVGLDRERGEVSLHGCSGAECVAFDIARPLGMPTE